MIQTYLILVHRILIIKMKKFYPKLIKTVKKPAKIY